MASMITLSDSIRTISMNALSMQLGSGQDFTTCGRYSNGYYISVMDGHGGNKCIDTLREFDFNAIAESVDPSLKIFDMLAEKKLNLFRSGSTFTFVKICVTDIITIQTFNVGDSGTIVFINGEVAHETTAHCLSNVSERARLVPYLQHPNPITPAWAPRPVSETKMSVVRSDTCNFKTFESLVPSQSLGHNNMTGYAPDVHLINCNLTDRIRVVSGSDGLWDMIIKDIDMEHLQTMSAEDLLSKASNRWSQNWEYAANSNDLNNFIVTNFAGSYDDVSVAIWENM